MKLEKRNKDLYKKALLERENILAIVSRICEQPTFDSCRNIENSTTINLARSLLKIADIPESAIIYEIPLYWSNQVEIYFGVYGDSNFYSLFAGIGIDNSFCFQLEIIGIYDYINEGYELFGELEDVSQ